MTTTIEQRPAERGRRPVLSTRNWEEEIDRFMLTDNVRRVVRAMIASVIKHRSSQIALKSDYQEVADSPFWFIFINGKKYIVDFKPDKDNRERGKIRYVLQ